MDNFSRAVEYSTASTGLRFANFIVDNIVYAIVWYLLQIILYLGMYSFIGRFNNSDVIFVFSFFFSLIFFSMFFSVQEYLFKGRTIGKFVTGTKAVSLDGEEPGFKKYFIRSLCRMIPFEPVSFLFSPFGWHDTLSKTRVVKVSDFERIRSRQDNIEQIGSATAA